MRRTLRYWTVLALCIASLHAETSRKALLIGNDSYPAKPLQNARNDARAFGAALTGLGYTTFVHLDANRQGIADAVASFAAGLTPGDTALFYYSGHGLQINGQNYLVPIDFQVHSQADVATQAYSLADMLSTLASHGATVKIVILDACRNNPFAGTRTMQDGWAQVQSLPGTFIAFGTAPGSVASDNPGEKNGLFTKALLQHVASSLEIYELFEEVRTEVIRESQGLQVPWVASSLLAAFHLNPAAQLNTQQSASEALHAVQFGSDMPSRNARALTSDSPSHSTSAQILVQQGLQLAENQDYNEAIRSLSEALSVDPKCSIALRLLGLIFHLLGRSDDAIQAYSRAISLNPMDYMAYYYRCLAAAPSDAMSAVRDCEASMGFNPRYAPPRFGLAAALLSLGDIQRSYSEVDEGIKLNPTSALGYALRGRINAKMGKYSAAQHDFQTAARLSTLPADASNSH